MTIDVERLARAALAHIGGPATPWRVALDKGTLPGKVKAYVHGRLDDPALTAADRLALVSKETSAAIVDWIKASIRHHERLEAFLRGEHVGTLRQVLGVIGQPGSDRYSRLVTQTQRLAGAVRDPSLWRWPLLPAVVGAAGRAGVEAVEVEGLVVAVLSAAGVEVEAWLRCDTSAEIAEREGVEERRVRELTLEMADLPKLAKLSRANAEHATDFELPSWLVEALHDPAAEEAAA